MIVLTAPPVRDLPRSRVSSKRTSCGLKSITIIALLLGSCVAQALTLLDPASHETIEVTVGQGRILRFTQPVESLFVADTEVADIRVVSPGVAYVYGKSSGETNLIALDGNEDAEGSLRLRVTPTTGQTVAARHSSARLSIQPAGKRLLATGETNDIETAVELDSLLRSSSHSGVPALNTSTYTGSPQINLRVRFAEVSRDQLLQYGVNWNALFNNGSFSFGLITAGAATGGNLVSAGLNSGSANIDVLLDALQSNGLLEILAEPNITAISGQTASFLAGGEIPVPVPVSNELIGVEYKPFGVSLQFTPTLLPNNRIALQVRPEVSSLAANSLVNIAGFSLPTFQVRRADTRVEVGSGQTFAIAGLFQRSSTRSLSKLPLLADIPVLGNLFKSKRFQRNETELVILITPYLVEPVSARSLATPLDSATSNPARALRASTLNMHEEFGFYVD
jgi:pilus assembly protein CpaC